MLGSLVMLWARDDYAGLTLAQRTGAACKTRPDQAQNAYAGLMLWRIASAACKARLWVHVRANASFLLPGMQGLRGTDLSKKISMLAMRSRAFDALRLPPSDLLAQPVCVRILHLPDLTQYQQLIRSKDVPSSITAALTNSSSSSNNKGSVPGAGNSTNRAAMAAAATVAANTGGAGAGRAHGSRAAGDGGSITGLQQQQQQQQQQAGAPSQSRTTPPPLLRSPSATEAMAAAKNQPLAAKLASLETMWVSSGQAARSPTPKRAQAAL
eukprot:scaffold172469_cov17-Tisochrysis_lutea.AAC.1